MQPITRWLSNEDLLSIYTAAYWNDLEEEKRKEWWIEDGNYEKCMNYLRESGLLTQYRQAEEHIAGYHSEAGITVADIAAGIGWVSALVSKLKNVREVL